MNLETGLLPHAMTLEGLHEWIYRSDITGASNPNDANLNASTIESIAQFTESDAVSRLNPGHSSIYNLMLQAAITYTLHQII